jgi:hypothetical protein
VMEGDIEAMKRQLVPNREIIVTLLGGTERARELLFGREGVQMVEELKPDNGRTRLYVSLQGEDADVSNLLADLVRADIPVMHFVEETRDLESVFMRATKGIVS